jgi:hypothetical protein
MQYLQDRTGLAQHVAWVEVRTKKNRRGNSLWLSIASGAGWTPTDLAGISIPLV